jgi:hypothetical protein
LAKYYIPIICDEMMYFTIVYQLGQSWEPITDKESWRLVKDTCGKLYEEWSEECFDKLTSFKDLLTDVLKQAEEIMQQ